MIPVDANILAYYFIESPFTDLARQVFAKDKEWVVPPLWRHELISILLKIARQGSQSEADLLTIWENANALVEGNEQEVDMRQAFHLAIQHSVSSYDAQYLALAQMLGIPLVTEDRKLRRAAPNLTVSMQDLLNKSE
ncbi:MAG: VapC toxin family PIN domain ribonuclease [Candidatus Parabeggiatoa sp. nov. 3]|nr:MAG: VapC toxin family PIN domain ribonuclease [Gammaproteobacteria bacterium]RKZ66519.1 MAG: VapC toxin family PIN domain ribonuclease [Gammaproteobacteria bacterium]RKZ87565.1 MAG: VapC toxin family PIN domain ribonuclease [Gammaproteobacteria bacterium]